MEQSGTEEPVRRAGLVDQVARRFTDEVTSGRWAVGDRIPTEPELVAQFGVGRNTVREAVQSLVHAGLVSREQGRGTFVISDSSLTGPLERGLAGGSRRDYLELRLALDTTAAQLAAQRRTEADVAALRELRDAREASRTGGDAAGKADADLALHRAVVAATHNPLYLELYTSMTAVFAAHMRDEDAEGHADEELSRRHHHDLVEAIAAQDPVRAADLVAAIFEPHMR
ncbi:FadR family transcriptional regulator [Nocardioides KLBMP 9356]|uniref:FadR family transcriptional regulator n=1 Tax=Nocardioides potassii TaxID=2911371 RepID=A0ABS9HDJ3_9ACTN|nr:FadR/GntR family transcriptional regulator [Nocardioides potassii]MCF6379260.1 FadR family transcriptional regulator [Nocardioides potassii]